MKGQFSPILANFSLPSQLITAHSFLTNLKFNIPIFYSIIMIKKFFFYFPVDLYYLCRCLFSGWGPSLLCICNKIFFMNDYFVKWFLFICWNDHVFFFIVLMWWIDFWILNPPCICDRHRTLSWSILCFISFKIQFANILSILIF